MLALLGHLSAVIDAVSVKINDKENLNEHPFDTPKDSTETCAKLITAVMCYEGSKLGFLLLLNGIESIWIHHRIKSSVLTSFRCLLIVGPV